MAKHVSHIKSNLTVNSYVNTETGAVVSSEYYNNVLPENEKSKYELTTSPKLPTADQLLEGEIAINYADDYETISLKNNLSEIVTFKPDRYNEEKYQRKVSKAGSMTRPVYISDDGNFDLCDELAGGTAVTLNGTSKAASTASFYAPTTPGTSGQFLSSDGSEPVWVDTPNTNTASLQVSDTTNKRINTAETTDKYLQFKDGENMFTVSDGTKSFSVNVTPSITRNVTGAAAWTAANVIVTTNATSGNVVKASGKTIATTLGNDDTTVPTSKAVLDAIDALPNPMVFKGTLGTDGTITTLPTASASNEGFTYKVITAGKYAGQKAEIGDLFISNGSAWNLIPSGDEPSGTVTNIATGTGLTGGPITTSGTISHADTSSQASVSNSGRTYIQSVTLDGMGHVTGLTSATETVVNTDRYVNSASFADDTTSTPASPVKMTLTRAGSDTATVVANIPKVSSTSAGVAPKGASVTSQSQSTKFLREDGSWAAPTYTENTDTKVRQTLTTADANRPLLLAYSQNTTTTTNVDNVSYRSNNIYANPNTGTITATNYVGNVNGVNIPSDAVFTDTKVTQTPTITSADYEVLFSSTADNTTRTEGARKSSNLKFNPSTGNLQATQLNGVTIGSSPKFTDTTYESKDAASGGTDVSLVTTGEKYTWNNKQNKVGKLGSATKPVYTSAAGTFAECSTYAGGTNVTLNGSARGASDASFYAPTTPGTSGQFLTSNGTGENPSWITVIPSDNLPDNLVYSSIVSITGVTNIPVGYTIVESYATSSQSVKLVDTATVTPGSSLHLVVFSGGSSDITLTIPHDNSIPTGSRKLRYFNLVTLAPNGTVVIPPDGVAEINFIFGSINQGIQSVYIRYI